MSPARGPIQLGTHAMKLGRRKGTGLGRGRRRSRTPRRRTPPRSRDRRRRTTTRSNWTCRPTCHEADPGRQDGAEQRAKARGSPMPRGRLTDGDRATRTEPPTRRAADIAQHEAVSRRAVAGVGARRVLPLARLPAPVVSSGARRPRSPPWSRAFTAVRRSLLHHERRSSRRHGCMFPKRLGLSPYEAQEDFPPEEGAGLVTAGPSIVECPAHGRSASREVRGAEASSRSTPASAASRSAADGRSRACQAPPAARADPNDQCVYQSVSPAQLDE